MLQKLKTAGVELISYASPNRWLEFTFQDYQKAHFGNLESLKLKAEPFLLKYLLSPNQILFDIGAHIGEYIYMGRQVVPSAHIYAFEPNPHSFKKLTRIYHDARIFNLAFSHENGTSRFKVPIIRGRAIRTRGSLNLDYQEKDESGQQIIEVDTQTIDTFVSNHQISTLGVIKIDVEGFEYQVIQGAVHTIRQQAPILIAELEQRHLKQPLDEIIDAIRALGYQCFYYDANTTALRELPPGQAAQVQNEKYFKVNPVHYVNNFIFIPPTSSVMGSLDDINQQIRQQTEAS